MSEIKTCYNLVVLETSEVKFGEVKTNKKTRKGILVSTVDGLLTYVPV